MRPLRVEDVDKAVTLWSIAFQYSDEERELRRRFAYLHPEWLRGVFRGKKLLAVLRLYPFRAFMGGAAIELGGVASVATTPEARGQGLADQLMRGALEEMRERGMTWTGLWPFSTAFYARYGYATCHEGHTWKMRTEDLPRFRSTAVERLPLEVTPAMQEVQRRWAAGYNLGIERHPDFWRLIRLHGNPLLFGVKGGFVQLALEKGHVEIEDLCWTEPEAGRALLGLVRSFAGQAPEVTWEAPAAQDLLDLDQVRGPLKGEVRRGMMARVVDVRKAFAALPVPPGEGSLEFTLTDPAAPWNEGPWRYSWRDGTARWDNQGDPPGLTMPELTRRILTLWRRPVFVADYF